MRTKLDLDLYNMIYSVTSYEELMLMLTAYGIKGYEYLERWQFNKYHKDDWKWAEFACAVARGGLLPF